MLSCYPNPFNPRTTLRLDLPASLPVLLTIHDAGGRRVSTLVDERLAAGRHEIPWLGTDAAGRGLPSGLYFYRLAAGERREGGKMLLLK
jgi:flagellar hook assembly protein FlgD